MYLPLSASIHQETKSLKKPQTLGLYKEYRALHNEESKVKTEVSR